MACTTMVVCASLLKARGLVSSIRSSSPSFVSDTPCLEIPANSSAEIELAFEPFHAAPLRGTLNFASNDVDEPELTLPLSGNLGGVAIGDEMVDFELSDLSGRRWRGRELRGKIVLLSYFATF